jgi:thiol-disulfide isomerase/thioredoxin
MKLRSLLPLLTLSLALLPGARAQDAAAPAAPAPSAADAAVIDEMKAIISGAGGKIRAGQTSAADFAPEIAQFDALLAKHPEKTDATAQVAVMKAMLYLQVIGDAAKGRELLLAVKTDYAGTEPANVVDKILAEIDAGAKAKATLAGLAGKPAPELHFTWSSKAGLKTLGDLKGKVVVLDFWATWCGPCLASFPNIREHVEHFKGSPVVFLGVTSIQGFVANMGSERIDTEGNPAKEIELLPQFMKAKNMTWDVAVSEEQVFNPDYGIEGIPYLAIIAPDGTVRFAGLHPGNPAADVAGKVEALLKEFKLPVPAKS